MKDDSLGYVTCSGYGENPDRFMIYAAGFLTGLSMWANMAKKEVTKLEPKFLAQASG